MRTALNVASAVLVIGSVAALASAVIDLGAGLYLSAGIGVASALPFVGEGKMGSPDAYSLLG